LQRIAVRIGRAVVDRQRLARGQHLVADGLELRRLVSFRHRDHEGDAHRRVVHIFDRQADRGLAGGQRLERDHARLRHRRLHDVGRIGECCRLQRIAVRIGRAVVDRHRIACRQELVGDGLKLRRLVGFRHRDDERHAHRGVIPVFGRQRDRCLPNGQRLKREHAGLRHRRAHDVGGVGRCHDLQRIILRVGSRVRDRQ